MDSFPENVTKASSLITSKPILHFEITTGSPS